MDGKPLEQKISEEFFLRTKGQAEDIYKNIGKVYCPYFKEEVVFNTKGLDHVKFKSWNKPRSRFDQYIRLKLLYLSPEILKRSHTVQGVWVTKGWERRKKYGKWEKLMVETSYYEFVAVIGKARIKIIVKEISAGPKFFWTIIPFWKTNSITNQRILHESDTEIEASDDF